MVEIGGSAHHGRDRVRGMGSALAGGAGGDSGGGDVGNALSAASLISGMGGAFGAGASWLTGAAGGGSLMGSLTAGSSLVGTAALRGTASGVSMIAGAVAPIVLGLSVLAKAMDYTITPNGGAIVANVGSRGAVGDVANRTDSISRGDGLAVVRPIIQAGP